MPTVKDNLESERLRANLHKIVRMLNRGIRQRAIAERVNVYPSTLRRFARELRRS
jgi:IS30 family transposase